VSYETNVQEQSTVNQTHKSSSFRLAFAGGIAFRVGKVLRSGDIQSDRISEQLTTGFGIEAELQYFFNENYGIALDVSYANYSATAHNFNVPDFGHVSSYKESQNILFLGPAFATRYSTGKWLLTANAGLGVLLYSDNISGTYTQSLTCTELGMTAGIGAEYKFAKQFSGGLKLSAVIGSTNTLYDENGMKYYPREIFSLSSTMILGYISFTIK
jgi:hypothetical protein